MGEKIIKKDTAEPKKMSDPTPIFKPASEENLDKRMEERIKNIIPVDQDAMILSDKMNEYISDMSDKLEMMRSKHGLTEDWDCICDQEALEEAGEDRERVEIPWTTGFVNQFCLRCGGYLEWVG